MNKIIKWFIMIMLIFIGIFVAGGIRIFALDYFGIKDHSFFIKKIDWIEQKIIQTKPAQN